MPEMPLKQPSCSYSACGPFTYIYIYIELKNLYYRLCLQGKYYRKYRLYLKNHLDKTFSEPDMAYVKFKDLAKRRLASMVYKLFDKKSTGTNTKMKLNKINNFQMKFINQLLENLKEEKFIHHHLKTIFGV